MNDIRTLAVAALLAASALATAAPAAAKPYGTCNGTVDYSCRYCSSSGGNAGYPPQYCSSYPQWYSWESCSVWVLNSCVAG